MSIFLTPTPISDWFAWYHYSMESNVIGGQIFTYEYSVIVQQGTKMFPFRQTSSNYQFQSKCVTSWMLLFKGLGVGKIDIFFKELTPHSRTYELHGQGKKKEKEMYKIKINKHLTLSY